MALPRNVMMAARVAPEERAAITRLARLHDRTPSREIRRAIRFYVEHFDTAQEFLQGRSERRMVP